MLACKLCKLACLSAGSYFEHLNSNHRFITQFSCPNYNCDRVYGAKNTLRNHLRSCMLNQIPQNTFSSTSNCITISPSSNLQANKQNNELSAIQIISELKKDMMKNAVKLMSDERIPRNKALEIYKESYDLYTKNILKIQAFEKQLRDNSDLTDLHDFFKNPSDIRTEYRLKKTLINAGYYLESRDYIIASNRKVVFVNSVQKIKEEKNTIKLFDLKSMFTKFLNLPGILPTIENFIKEKQECKDSISNVVQTPLWEDLISQETKNDDVVYLPLLLYFDDFEPQNALGSHSGAYKIGAVYCILQCLPPYMASLLAYIFPVSLFFSGDRKHFGTDRIFRPIIKLINDLHTNGVKVKDKTVKFIVTTITGDNLGLNGIYGFMESFSFSNYFCRFCKTHRTSCAHLLTEDESTIRDVINYARDAILQCGTDTGVKLNCIFNELDTFHVTINLCVDVMHDLFEGVFHYDLTNIISSLIYKYKLFSLDYLNQCIKSFNYGPMNKNKIIEDITVEMLNNKTIRASASEMQTLFVNFSKIIGHKIPRELEEWKIYILMRQINDIVCSKIIDPRSHELLKTLVHEHHELYIRCYGGLKPKHHFMVHYPRIMKRIGSLFAYSNLRFESFHKKFKNVANSVNCRINLLTTFATKYEYQFANLLLNFDNNFFKPEFGKKESVDSNILFKKYKFFKTANKVFGTNWVDFAGIHIKRNCVILIGKAADDMPIFGLVNHIICVDDKHIFFCCQEVENLGLDDHFQCYSVNLLNDYFMFEFNASLLGKTSYIYEAINNKKFVSF